MEQALKISYCNSFILEELKADSEPSIEKAEELNLSKFLSDFDGIFKAEDPFLYIVSHNCFFSASLGHTEGKTNSSYIHKHGKIALNPMDFVVSMGKVYFLYMNFVQIYSLDEFKERQKIPSTDPLLRIISLRDKVYVCSRYDIKSVYNETIFMKWLEPDDGIVDIKPSCYNNNAILVVFEKSFEIIGEENDCLFKLDWDNPFSVDFVNEHILVVFDISTNTAKFIEWTNSSEVNFTINFSDSDLLDIKVKNNSLVFTQHESGKLFFVFYNEKSNNFLTFTGSIPPFEALDFDCTVPYIEETHGDDSITLNLYLNSNYSLFHFALDLDLDLNFAVLYTSTLQKRSLDPRIFDSPSDLSSIEVAHRPLVPEQIFKMIPEVPKFIYPPPLSPKPALDYSSELESIKSFFTNDYLSSLFQQSLDINTLTPSPQVLREPIINPTLIENLKSMISSIPSLISR